MDFENMRPALFTATTIASHRIACFQFHKKLTHDALATPPKNVYVN